MNIEKENEYRIERNHETLDMNTMEQVAGGMPITADRVPSYFRNPFKPVPKIPAAQDQ